MEATKLKLECSVCGQPFATGRAKRVTCGQPACRKQRGLETAQAYRRKIYILKRLKCPYCSEFFTFKSNPKNRQRATCGQAKCRTEHNLVISRERGRQIVSDPALNELKKKRMNEAYAVKSAIYRELKSHAGIKIGSGRLSNFQLMLLELEKEAGVLI